MAGPPAPGRRPAGIEGVGDRSADLEAAFGAVR
jgi:hypothetical protein